ncbi:MAG TPA: TadE/TadG family type IV pilus assembly protein [Nocardioides sp.]|uniref:TadE/TadG family type IV pilus assembly protein n=1 Tax=Nocardioides sp. TaxID=35761 RepID=UPI002F41B84A
MLLSAKRRRDDGGAAAVEFALVVPLLLVLVFGIIQYGWYFYAMQSGTSATGDALRRLTVGACQDNGELTALVSDDLGAALQGSLVAGPPTYKDASGADSATPVAGGSVTLTVQFDTLDLHFPFLPVPDGGTVIRTQTARVEDATPAAGVTCS